MRKFLTYFFLLISTLFFAQQKTLPNGWDRIILEGKEGYMNLVTGETTHVFPEKPAEKPLIAIEIDPSILHTIKKGETLYSIARKHNISVDDIYRLNAQFDYDNLKIGQQIVVGYDKSKEGKVIYKVDEDAYTNPSNNTYYYVKKGETLFGIARKKNMTVSKLKKYNNLKTITLKIGQRLRLVPKE